MISALGYTGGLLFAWTEAFYIVMFNKTLDERVWLARTGQNRIYPEDNCFMR